MGSSWRTWPAVFLCVLGAAGLRADEAADKLAAQKKAADDNWAALDLGEPPAQAETKHLLIYAPKAFAPRLKDWGVLLEKFYATASRPLEADKAEQWWPGKMAVYLVAQREHFTTFVRRVEKRRLEADEMGSFEVEGDLPHVVASPPRDKLDPPVEVQAGQQLASAMLRRRAGPKVPVADWLVSGFGRATWYRTAPAAAGVSADRAQAARLARGGRKAADVWGSGLDAAEAVVLQGSVADFLAYGPGASKFLALLAAYQPEENMERKTTEQALDAAGIKPDALDGRWRAWVGGPR